MSIIYTGIIIGHTDTAENEEKIEKAWNVAKAMEETEEKATNAAAGIEKAFRIAMDNMSKLADALEGLEEPIERISESLQLVSTVDFSAMLGTLAEMSDVLSDIAEKLNETDWTGIAGLAMQAFSQGFDIYSWNKTARTQGKTAGQPTGGGKTAAGSNLLVGAESAVGIFSELAAVLDIEAIAATASTAAELAHSAATAAWNAICSAATAVTGAFGAALSFLTSPIGLVILGITALIAIIVLLVMNWDTVCQALAQFDEWLTGVFAVDWTEQFGAFGEVLNAFFANVESIWNAVKTIFEGIVQFVTGVFSGDWQSAWEGIVQVFTGIWEGLQAAIKAPINGVIGLINGLISAVVSGINSAIDAFNALRFTVPDWVPGIGGESIGFNIGKISAPRIPLLAQGAVLPANRPFLAVVGDQKSGTNVEAPLATIQEALANVLARQGAGDITITFAGDLAQLGRVLKPVIDRENRRVGGNLARGAV